MHPLCLTLIRRPDLAFDHLSAYAAILNQEASLASQALANRAMAWLVVLMCSAIGLVLSGTALMLGMLQNQFHWVLVAVPGVMLLCAGIALSWAKQAALTSHFANIKAQFNSDALALRLAAEHAAKT